MGVGRMDDRYLVGLRAGLELEDRLRYRAYDLYRHPQGTAEVGSQIEGMNCIAVDYEHSVHLALRGWFFHERRKPLDTIPL